MDSRGGFSLFHNMLGYTKQCAQYFVEILIDTTACLRVKNYPRDGLLAGLDKHPG